MELFTAQQIQSLNELELLVYRYINEHPNTVPFMRIRELAAEAHVSTTTVLHFCKKMGCDGYAQFKWKLKEQAGTNQETHLPDTLNELQNFLWRVGTPEYDAALDEAAGLIARAERVFLVGIGTHAKDVYEALAQLLDLDENAADAPHWLPFWWAASGRCSSSSACTGASPRCAWPTSQTMAAIPSRPSRPAPSLHRPLPASACSSRLRSLTSRTSPCPLA